MSPTDTNRRGIMIGHYENGEVTAAAKGPDQQMEISTAGGH
jgi:hypothetical protein